MDASACCMTLSEAEADVELFFLEDDEEEEGSCGCGFFWVCFLFRRRNLRKLLVCCLAAFVLTVEEFCSGCRGNTKALGKMNDCCCWFCGWYC